MRYSRLVSRANLRLFPKKRNEPSERLEKLTTKRDKMRREREEQLTMAILEVVAAHGPMSTNAICARVSGNRSEVYTRTKRMAHGVDEPHLLAWENGPRNAIMWTLSYLGREVLAEKKSSIARSKLGPNPPGKWQPVKPSNPPDPNSPWAQWGDTHQEGEKGPIEE